MAHTHGMQQPNPAQRNLSASECGYEILKLGWNLLGEGVVAIGYAGGSAVQYVRNAPGALADNGAALGVRVAQPIFNEMPNAIARGAPDINQAVQQVLGNNVQIVAQGILPGAQNLDTAARGIVGNVLLDTVHRIDPNANDFNQATQAVIQNNAALIRWYVLSGAMGLAVIGITAYTAKVLIDRYLAAQKQIEFHTA